MQRLRILLVSNTRPSRAWRFVQRLEAEFPRVQTCAVAQRHVSSLDAVQQTLAVGEQGMGAETDLRAKARVFLRRLWDTLARRVLWCLHGFPYHPASLIQTEDDLARKCGSLGVPFMALSDLNAVSAEDFARQNRPDLIVWLGPVPPLGNRVIAQHEALWATFDRAASGVVGINIQYAASREESRTVASVSIPLQARDGLIGIALKTDLLTDDLLAKAIAHLQGDSADGLDGALASWTKTVLTPYLSQIEPRRRDAGDAPRRCWSRSAWSLSLHTFLLCSPPIAIRNWIRAARGKYPVLILAHHLVSDRGHRMGMSTEAFWRQVRFLKLHYRIVSLAEATELLASGRVDVPTVALTFDDGYADNFVSLRAVAEEMEIPVALFITTQPVQLRVEFQHDIVKGHHGAFAMTWDQIRYWQARGAEFGSHTRTHVRCGFVDDAVLREELVGSRDDFECQLGQAPQFFAFPYGDRDNMPFNAVKIASATYPFFLSSYGGENLPQNGRTNHLFRKKSYSEPWELELELQSVFDYVERLKNLLRSGTEPESTLPPPAKRLTPALDTPANQLASTPSSGGISQLAKPR